MVTKDEVPNPQNLKMYMDLNGQRMQDGSTKTMIFGVTKLVSYVSQFMTLEPGDVITTGTPPGVGMGVKKDGKPAPVFLKKGDVMHVGIQGLGEQIQKVVAFKRKA
jgi:2-keto-4-pentenoate hydratase/2-oxohepta-3-ene-1,7-dioic acid hydratase in catechol pathway